VKSLAELVPVLLLPIKSIPPSLTCSSRLPGLSFDGAVNILSPLNIGSDRTVTEFALLLRMLWKGGEGVEGGQGEERGRKDGGG
jgi:hypothetical protein